jgi:hypothetical protein
MHGWHVCLQCRAIAGDAMDGMYACNAEQLQAMPWMACMPETQDDCMDAGGRANAGAVAEQFPAMPGMACMSAMQEQLQATHVRRQTHSRF